jgi:hypothetical protein
MSDAYERERQNNSRLSELSAKVTALRGVTIDIYDNARDQGVIDNTVSFHLHRSTSEEPWEIYRFPAKPPNPDFRLEERMSH